MMKKVIFLILIVSHNVIGQSSQQEQYEVFFKTLIQSAKTKDVTLFKTLCVTKEDYMVYSDNVKRRIDNPYQYVKSGSSKYSRSYDEYVRKQSPSSYQSYLNTVTEKFYRLRNLENKENFNWQNASLKAIYNDNDSEILIVLKSNNIYFAIEIEVYQMGTRFYNKKTRIFDGFDGYETIGDSKQFEEWILKREKRTQQHHARLKKNAEIESEKYFTIKY